MSVEKAPMINRSLLDVSPILPRLPQGLSAQLFAGAASRQLEAGKALFLAGQLGDGCYRLEQGLVKVIITSPQGEERILAILGPGAVVGELSVIDGGPRSASVIAVKECTLSFVSRAAFKECTRDHPEIYHYLVDVLAARLRETDAALIAASFLTVKSRLARALLELAKFLGQKEASGCIRIRHKVSQNDLAAMAGIARENVSRALSDWKRRNLVTRSNGDYCLHDMAALQREADP